MSTERELSRLFQAERGECAAPDAPERGWERLESALVAGMPPMPVSRVPLEFGTSTTVKWGAATGVAVLVAGAAALTRSHGDPVRSTPTSVVAPTVAALEHHAPEPTTSVPAIPEPVPERPAASDTAERNAAFDEELRLIKLAKSEIDAGRAHLAEVWLDEHARRFPNGVFRTERSALGILVECSSDRARGELLGRQFVRANPRSPLVDRIARACDLGESAGESKKAK
jgi:hypothetical protein